MNEQSRDVISDNRIFVWIALATAVILMIPLVAMQVTTEVNWNRIDFVVFGALLFGMASLFVVLARRVPRKRRVLVASAVVIAFLYAWAELGVGIFTNLGS